MDFVLSVALVALVAPVAPVALGDMQKVDWNEIAHQSPTLGPGLSRATVEGTVIGLLVESFSPPEG
jgi:hypothetical protein